MEVKYERMEGGSSWRHVIQLYTCVPLVDRLKWIEVIIRIGKRLGFVSW